jgi:hypothetical protein
MANLNYKLNLLETRLGQIEKQQERLEGMLKRTYAFMKQCERTGMVPEGWTTDSGNGGVSFRPLGGSTGAAKPDEQMLRAVRSYQIPSSPARSPSISNNNNDTPVGYEKAQEERELKRLRLELNQFQEERKEEIDLTQKVKKEL